MDQEALELYKIFIDDLVKLRQGGSPSLDNGRWLA